MIQLYRPALQELSFRKTLLADPATMAYNAAWGGTIDFPEDRWETWYRNWVDSPADIRFYRYLYDTEKQIPVGEAAWHREEESGRYLCDVIVHARFRNCGYGTAGLQLLCSAAKENGIAVLYDRIPADNPSLQLFLKNGFVIEAQDETAVLVRRVL